MTGTDVAGNLDAGGIWKQLVERQSAVGAILAGVLILTAAIPFLSWVESFSPIAWSLALAGVGLSTGYLVRTWGRAVTVRFGMFSGCVTAICGAVSLLLTCRTTGDIVSYSLTVSRCVDFIALNVVLIVGALAFSCAAAYLLGFRRLTAHDLLAIGSNNSG